MASKYSKTPFEGYTHRFLVKIKTSDPFDHNIDIYSDSDSLSDLDSFISKKKSDKVVSFNIIHRSSKEQDDLSAKFIQDVLGQI